MRTCDARLVILAPAGIEEAVHSKRFRLDLYKRLCKFRIDLPPLRERREDIPSLTAYFLDRLKGMSNPPVDRVDAAAMRALLSHTWPENVRELERSLRFAIARTTGSLVRVGSLPVPISSAEPPRRVHESSMIDVGRPLGEVTENLLQSVERSYLIELLRRYRGRIAAVARHSGLSRKSVSEKMGRLGLVRAHFADQYLFEDMKLTS
jgi:DNA-binding NtrC family response regulator